MADKQEWLPPVNFFFQVDFMNKYKGKGLKVSFQEVSGLGWNLNKNKTAAEQSISCKNLVLKRPLGPFNQEFSKWIEGCAGSKIYSEENIHNIVIKLLDKERRPLAVWLCAHAYPVGYSIGDLNANKGDILLETIELKYERLERKK